MIKLPLPITMGKSFVDHRTLEIKCIHPVLDVSSSHCCVKEEIIDWLVETFEKKFHMGFDGTDYFIAFANEEDLLLFKLKWL